MSMKDFRDVAKQNGLRRDAGERRLVEARRRAEEIDSLVAVVRRPARSSGFAGAFVRANTWLGERAPEWEGNHAAVGFVMNRWGSPSCTVENLERAAEHWGWL